MVRNDALALAKIAGITMAGLMMVSAVMGCDRGAKPYKPKPAYSGAKPSLPAVPTLPNKKKKEGRAYTIWGAIHDLRSVVHAKDFRNPEKPTTIVGYIVKTNYQTACKEGENPCLNVPECAVHRTGKEDPADCHAPVPTFWIADEKGETNLDRKAIPVKGWASNFAQIYSMMEDIDKKQDDAKFTDEFFSIELPNPIPNVGAKVKVTGLYGVTYSRSTAGAASNPRTGILTVNKIEYTDKPPEKAVLPGMRRR